jgi:hypothetical protein
MLLWVASYPRSGNRLLRTVLRRQFGQESKDGYVHGIIGSPEAIQAAAAAESLVVVKTHNLPAADDYPAIYIVRDGRDSLVSYAWFALEIHQGLDRKDVTADLYRAQLVELIQREAPFGSWNEHVTRWTCRPRTAVVRFEQLVAAPQAAVASALEALGIRLPAIAGARIPSFEELKAASPKLVRRGQVGAWRDEFPADLLPLFWKIHGRAMRDVGYGEEGDAGVTSGRAA